MTAVDWSRFRKCPVCQAEIGEPCLDRSGFSPTDDMGLPGPRVRRPNPHGSRKSRAVKS